MNTPWQTKQDKVKVDPLRYIRRPASTTITGYSNQIKPSNDIPSSIARPKNYPDQIRDAIFSRKNEYKSSNIGTQNIIDKNEDWVSKHPHTFDKAIEKQNQEDQENEQNNDLFQYTDFGQSFVGKATKYILDNHTNLSGDFGSMMAGTSVNSDDGKINLANEQIYQQKDAESYETALNQYKILSEQYKTGIAKTRGYNTQGLLQLLDRINSLKEVLDNPKIKGEYEASLQNIDADNNKQLLQKYQYDQVIPGATGMGMVDYYGLYKEGTKQSSDLYSNTIKSVGGQNNFDKLSPQDKQTVINKQKRNDFIKKQTSIIENAKKDREKHMADLVWWKQNFKVSQDYLDKKAKYVNAGIFDPNYWKYEVAGTMGSSWSDYKDQLIASGAGLAGGITSIAAGGPIGALMGVTIGGVEYYAKTKSSENENYAEVSQRYTQNVIQQLKEQGLYDYIMPKLMAAEKDYKRKIGFSEQDLKNITNDDAIADASMDKIDNRYKGFKQILISQLAGSKMQFDRDMATTALTDLITTACDNIGLPTGKLLKTVGGKIISSDIKEAIQHGVTGSLDKYIGKNTLRYLKEGALAGNPVAETTATGLLGHAIFDTTGAVGNVAAHALYKAMPETVQAMSRRILTGFKLMGQNILDKALPTMANKTLAKKISNLGTRMIISALSEGAEEGKQYINQNTKAEDYYMGQSQSMWDDIKDDFCNGVSVDKALLSCIGLGDSPYKNDQEFWQNYRGGFVLGGLHTGVITVATSTPNIYRQIKSDQIIGQNALINKMDAKSDIERGALYSKAATQLPFGRNSVHASIDNLRKMREDHGLAYGDDYWKEQHAIADRVMNVAKSNDFKARMKAKGIKYGSDEYNMQAASLARIYKEKNEIQQELNKVNQSNLELQNSKGVQSRVNAALNKEQSIKDDISKMISESNGQKSNLTSREIVAKELGETTEEQEQQALDMGYSNLDEAIDDLVTRTNTDSGATGNRITSMAFLSHARAILELKQKLASMRSYRKAFEERFGKKISEEEASVMEKHVNDEYNELLNQLQKYGLDGIKNKSIFEIQKILDEQQIDPELETKLKANYSQTAILRAYQSFFNKQQADILGNVEKDEKKSNRFKTVYNYIGKDSAKDPTHTLYSRYKQSGVENDEFYSKVNDIVTGQKEEPAENQIVFDDPIKNAQTQTQDEFEKDEYKQNANALNDYLANLEQQAAFQQSQKDKKKEKENWPTEQQNPVKSQGNDLKSNPTPSITPDTKKVNELQKKKDRVRKKIEKHHQTLKDIKARHKGELYSGGNINEILEKVPVLGQLIYTNAQLGVYKFEQFINDVQRYFKNKFDIQDLTALKNAYQLYTIKLDQDKYTSSREIDNYILSEQAKQVTATQNTDEVDNISDINNDMTETVDGKLSNKFTVVTKSNEVFTVVNMFVDPNVASKEKEITDIINDKTDIKQKQKALVELGCDEEYVERVLNSHMTTEGKAIALNNTIIHTNSIFARLGENVSKTIQKALQNGINDIDDKSIPGIVNIIKQIDSKIKSNGLTIVSVNQICYDDQSAVLLDIVCKDVKGNVHVIDITTQHGDAEHDYSDTIQKLTDVAKNVYKNQLQSVSVVSVKLNYNYDRHNNQINNLSANRIFKWQYSEASNQFDNNLPNASTIDTDNAQVTKAIDAVNNNNNDLGNKTQIDNTPSTNPTEARITKDLAQEAAATSEVQLDDKDALESRDFAQEEAYKINQMSNKNKQKSTNRTGVYRPENGFLLNFAEIGRIGELANATVQPDFLQNAIFSVQANPSNDHNPFIVIKYNNKEYKVHILTTESESDPARRIRAAIAFVQKHPEYVVKLKMSRTNGKEILDQNNPTSIKGKEWFEHPESATIGYTNRTERTGNTIGYVRFEYIKGSINKAFVVGAAGDKLYEYQGSVEDRQNLSGGQMVYIKRFTYPEDPDNIRTAIINLSAPQFTDRQYDYIMDLLIAACKHEQIEVAPGVKIDPMYILQFVAYYGSATTTNLHIDGNEDKIFALSQYNEISFGTTPEGDVINYRLVDSNGNVNEEVKNRLLSKIKERIKYLSPNRFALAKKMNDGDNTIASFIKTAIRNNAGNPVTIFPGADEKDPGYTFSNEDFKEGKTLLGYMITHDRINTSFNGFTNALLRVDDIKVTKNKDEEFDTAEDNIENQVEDIQQQNDDSTDIPDTKQDKPNTIPGNIDDLFSFGRKIPNSTHTNKITDEKLDRIKRYYKLIFGDDFDPTIIDDIIKYCDDGKIVGRVTKDALTLSKQNVPGTEYHEAFHRVLELLVDPETRQKIYDRYKKQHGNKLSEREIAEELADLYMQYRLGLDFKNKDIFANRKLLKRIGNYIKIMTYTITGNKLKKLFVQIDNGKFANKKVTKENKEAFLAHFGKEGLAKTITNIETNQTYESPNLINDDEVNQLSQGLAVLLHKMHISLHGQFSKFQLDEHSLNLFNHPKFVHLKNQYTAGDSRSAKVFKELLTPDKDGKYLLWMSIQNRVADYLSSYLGKVHTNLTDEFDQNKDTLQSDDTASADVGDHTHAAYEFSQLSRATERITNFFATVTQAKKITMPDGSIKYVIDTDSNIFGLPTYVPLHTVWNRTLNDMHDLKNVDDLKNKLEKLSATGDPIYYALYNKFLILYNSVKNSKNYDNKYYDDKARLIGIASAIKSQKLDFTQCIARGSALTIKSIDQDKNIYLYPRMWSQNFISGLSGIISKNKTKDGKLTFEKGMENAIQSIYSIMEGIRTSLIDVNNPQKIVTFIYKGKSYKFSLVDPNGLKQAKRGIIFYIKKLGIDIDEESFDYLLMHTYGSYDVDGLEKFFNDDGTSNFFSVFKHLISDTASKDGVLLYTPEYISGNMQKYGFMKAVANMYSQYKHSKEELSVNVLGNKKAYTITQNNTESDLVELFQGDLNDPQLQQIINYDYNLTTDENGNQIGSVLLKQVVAGKGCQIASHIFNGFKTNDKNDQGVEYLSMPEHEDLAGKYELLASGALLFPTLSDKSTYPYLTGVKLPGIDYNNANSIANDRVRFVERGTGPNKTTIAIFPDKVLDQFIEYAKTERASIVSCMKDLGIIQENDHYVLSEEEKIKNYHTKNKQGVEPNGTRFATLTEIYVLALDSKGQPIQNADGSLKTKSVLLNDPKKSSVRCLQIADEEFFSKDVNTQRSIIQHLLNDRLHSALDRCVELNLIGRTELKDDVKGNVIASKGNHKSYLNFTRKGLNGVKISQLFNEYSKEDIANNKNLMLSNNTVNAISTSKSIVAYVADAMCKGIMSTEESERCFTGNPRFFKWTYDENHLIDRGSDESKRFGGFTSTGDNNIDDFDTDEISYSCAEIKDVEIQSQSDIYPQLENMFLIGAVKTRIINNIQKSDATKEEKSAKIKAVYNEQNLDELKKQITDEEFNTVKKEAKASSDSYAEGINVADGASYITAKMAEKLLTRIGLFDGDMKQAFDILTDNSTKYSYKNKLDAYNKVTQVIIGTQKYSAYGFRSQNGVLVHYYNKTALFPLFPSIAFGRMHDIYQKMQDEDVDMVMMDSAVKVGSQGAIGYDELGTKAFNKYVQNFKYIRKQLNTDPNDKENMSVGTQALKICLANLRLDGEYTDSKGNKVSGMQLLDNLMNSMKQLSSMAYNELIQKFLNKDGSINVNEFSKFVQEQLSGREADKNMLEALQVKDGNFTYNLAATSSMSWIQAIMCSKINKEVIDVSTPGHAYFQRSVLGMEDYPQIMSQEEAKKAGIVLNGGKKLQMINNDNSMDCAISIDFFEKLVPKKFVGYQLDKRGNKVLDKDGNPIKIMEKRTFAEARQWLINNNIIGQNAKGNLMVYRIPTQAQSSIHCMRCVDVLPGVKDTIILPAEFTKITGSDFDIDKLFINMLNYNVVNDIATSDFKEGTKQYYQNQILNTYFTLLKDVNNTVDQLYRSVDKDTTLVKSIADLINDKEEQYEHSYDYDTVDRQSRIKNFFATGKMGIGPFALNNNSQILTTLYNVSLNDKDTDNGLLTKLGMTSLHEAEDRNNEPILHWLSALINAHVDVAKDPYISKLNINSFSYNMVNLLVRTGFGRQGLCLVAQPIMKKIAAGYINGSSYYMKNPEDTVTQVTNKYMAQSTLDYFSPDNTENTLVRPEQMEKVMSGSSTMSREFFAEDSTQQDLADKLNEYMDNEVFEEIIKSGKEYGSITVQDKQAMQKNPGKVIEKTYNIEQVQYDVMRTWFTLEKSAKALSDLVKYTKIDTKKQGKTVLQQVEYGKGLQSLLNGEKFIGLDDLIQNSFIGDKTNYSLRLMKSLQKDVILSATDGFAQLYDDFREELFGNRLISDQDSRMLENAVVSYIKSRFFINTDYIQKENEKRLKENPNAITINIHNMFFGKFTMADRLNGIRNWIESNNVERLRNNQLLKALTQDVIKNRKGTFDYPVLLRLLDSGEHKLEMDNIIDAWDELLHDEDANVRNFATDLVIYSFYTSCDNVGYTKFFKYVPNSWRESSGYCDYMDKMFNILNSDYISPITNQIAIDNMMLNNWYDSNIVRNYSLKKMNQVTTYHHESILCPIKTTTKKEIDEQTGLPVKKTTISVTTFGNRLNKYRPKYIKFNDKEGDPTTVKLYKYIGALSLGNEEVPIYGLVQPRSLKLVGGYNVYEYGQDIMDYGNRMFNDSRYSDFLDQISSRLEQAGEQNIMFNDPNDFVEDTYQNKPLDNRTTITDDEDNSSTQTQAENTNSAVETYKGNWTREEVAKQTDKVFLFGDNTDDRLNTHHIPTSTQAVIRGLDNAIGIDTKKDRGVGQSSYFTNDDFDVFKKQVDDAIQKAKNSGKTIVIPEGGIGTGKAQLKERAPKLFDYLQNKLDELNNSNENADEYEDHSGGAYGADTEWDIIGRRYGLTKFNHYRDEGNQRLSKRLRDGGVKARVLTKEQIEEARNKESKLLGILQPDTLQGNLQVRNYYQVANSDGIFAIATMNQNMNGVTGGTNTAVQLGIKMNKEVHVWNTIDEKWYRYNGAINKFEQEDTPVLTKKFAGIGTRDIENYQVKNKNTGKFEDRPQYLGQAKEAAARQAIEDVYAKTFGKQQSTIETASNTSSNKEEPEILNKSPRDNQGRLLAPNGKPSNLTERQYAQVRTKAFKEWFGDWEKAFIIPMSFMPKKGWVVGKIIDNPIDAANICDNTQIKVLNSIIKQFGKPNNKGKFYAKPVTIWAKSPINNKQIHHSTVAVKINGKIYLYDMPQSEYIKYNSENNGTVIKEYSPRLIEYTEENLKTLYGTADENIHLNDESILDNDIIELPLTNASKVIDENGEPLVVYHGTNFEFDSFSKDKRGSYTKAKSATLAFFAASNIKNAEKYLVSESERFQPFRRKDGSEDLFDVFEKQLQENHDDILEAIYKRELELEKDPLFQIEELKNKYGDGYILSLLTNPEVAKKYPEQAKLYKKEVDKIEDKLLLKINPHIKSMFLNIRNPKIDDDKNTGHRANSYNKRISDALQEGKDGGVIKNTKDPIDTDVYYFFEPNQIKSATEDTGTSNKDDNINNNQYNIYDLLEQEGKDRMNECGYK